MNFYLARHSPIIKLQKKKKNRIICMPHILEIQKINVQSQPSSLIHSKNPPLENLILSKCKFYYLLE